MRPWRDAVRVLGLAWLVALVLLVPTAVGLYIDRIFDTSPWALLVSAVFAILVASAGFTFATLRRYDTLAPRKPSAPPKEPE